MARSKVQLGITGHSWLNSKLEVKISRRHSKGVFAREPVPARERVAIFGGDVMLIDEIKVLPRRLRQYPMQIEERFVLGSRTGIRAERTDYFNHSCDPNCGFKGQMFLVAMRDIRKGEELTFDYAMVVSPSVGSDIVFELDCQCGSGLCRKRITEQDWEIPELRLRYSGFFSQYLADKIVAKPAGEARAMAAASGSVAAPAVGRRTENARRIAIVMNDEAASEIHHFVEQANRAQDAIRLMHVLAPEKTAAALAKQRIHASEACALLFDLRNRSKPKSGDIFIGVTIGDVFDEHDNEFFVVNGKDHGLKGRPFPHTAAISLYYLNRKSWFMRGQRGGAWRALSDTERAQKTSDSILLLLLTALASETTGAECHETSVGCIMDFCQTPSDLLEALRSGFIFCGACRSSLERTADGRAIVNIAERLSQHRYTPLEMRTVFLSYAWKDERSVLAIDQWLRDRGILTRLDKRDFYYGRRIPAEIKRVMDGCSAVVIFYSKNSKGRKYTGLEREMAFDMRLEGKSRVIYFCLDDTAFPDSHEATHLAVMAKGKSFDAACGELLSGILALGRPAAQIDLSEFAKRAPWAR